MTLETLKSSPNHYPQTARLFSFLISPFSFPILNTFFKILICSICCSPLISTVATAHSSVSTAQVIARSEARPKVGFSFDHLAGNQKVQRTFVSGEMLTIAREQLLKNDRWEFKHVVDRLSSVLALHTHSRSTTATIRSNYEAVSKMKDYELLMQLSVDNVEIIVFGIRSKGRKLKELLIFRFRDNYCSRVVQLTGELTTDDIGNIIKLNKKL